MQIMKIDGLDHLVLTVADMDASVAFYRDVLGMEAEDFRAADGSRRTALMFGGQKINLHPASAPFEPHARVPTPGSADLCFLTRQSLASWLVHLGDRVIEGPVTRTGALGPISSLYLRDPDGNLVEVAQQVPRD